MSKNVLVSKYDKKKSVSVQPRPQNHGYICVTSNLKEVIIFRRRVHSFTILDIRTFEIQKAK